MQFPATETFEEKKTSIFRSIGINNLDELSQVESITDLSIIKDLIKINPLIQPEAQGKIYEILERSGALLKGHFMLLSGFHSKYFLRFSKISRNTQDLDIISRVLCDQIMAKRLEFDTVLSPETAGSALAITISQRLIEEKKEKIQTIYAKTDEFKRPTALINWMDLKAGSKVLLVNDMVSTGYGIKELARLTERYGGSVAGICVFTFRTDWQIIETLRKKYTNFFFSITDSSKLNNFTYTDEKSCPLCENLKTKPVHSRYLN